ncbi:MAG: Rpn family recombination-promoting nuclease/putative transposase [Blautia sp.]|nr:Rpn family recombination-promoting nuclease/putative transposase [Blautia sp.]
MPSPKITWLTTHREAKQWPSTSGEYLTGFYKDDRLIPVITVVVYFGSDTWNAPRSLHEMLSVQDPEILSLVPDYRINLFSPAEIKDEELDKLESNLKEVMLFIKYSKDKRKLQELTSQSPGFRSFELKAARVIDSITGINLRFTETERSVNMCQAVQEMCDDARAEGHASGLSEGHAKGLQDHALLTAQRMLQDPSFSPEDISRFSGLPLEDVLKLREK